ncbi:hypothetical protein GCM10009636_20860 [Arthrobacter koreensis]
MAEVIPRRPSGPEKALSRIRAAEPSSKAIMLFLQCRRLFRGPGTVSVLAPTYENPPFQYRVRRPGRQRCRFFLPHGLRRGASRRRVQPAILWVQSAVRQSPG